MIDCDHPKGLRNTTCVECQFHCGKCDSCDVHPVNVAIRWTVPLQVELLYPHEAPSSQLAEWQSEIVYKFFDEGRVSEARLLVNTPEGRVEVDPDKVVLVRVSGGWVWPWHRSVADMLTTMEAPVLSTEERLAMLEDNVARIQGSLTEFIEARS